MALCEQQGIEVGVIHQTDPVTLEEERAAVGQEIITVSRARWYGRLSPKTKKILQVLQEPENPPDSC